MQTWERLGELPGNRVSDYPITDNKIYKAKQVLGVRKGQRAELGKSGWSYWAGPGQSDVVEWCVTWARVRARGCEVL